MKEVYEKHCQKCIKWMTWLRMGSNLDLCKQRNEPWNSIEAGNFLISTVTSTLIKEHLVWQRLLYGNILQASQGSCHFPTGLETVAAHSPVQNSGPTVGGLVSGTCAGSPTEHQDICGTQNFCDLLVCQTSDRMLSDMWCSPPSANHTLHILQTQKHSTPLGHI